MWRHLENRAERTIPSVKLVPYVGEGNSPDEFLIKQPVLRYPSQPWAWEARQRMEVGVVESRIE
jgi:hypothetical protein